MQSVTRASIHAEISALRSEIDISATGVLQETLDWASQLNFDQRSPTDDPTGLTPRNQWITRDWQEITALEELNGATHVIRRQAGQDTLRFNISAQVDYMAKSGENWIVSASPTMTKRVIFEVTGAMDSQARAERLYSQSGF